MLSSSLGDDGLLIDTGSSDYPLADQPPGDDAGKDSQMDEEGRPRFPPIKMSDGPHNSETRKVPMPPHRMTPLKKTWPKIYPPLVEHLKLQVRVNTKARAVEVRTSKHTTDPGALQKSEDYLKAFSLGFDIDDAIALLRLDVSRLWDLLTSYDLGQIPRPIHCATYRRVILRFPNKQVLIGND